MGRRIEVELTSNCDDGSWTWRAAGAKKPKGMLNGSVLYEGAEVGDVVKAEAEYHVDGIEILEVTPPSAKKARSNILEMKPRALRDDELVTTQRVKRNDRGGRDRHGKDRGGRDRNRSGGGRSDGRSSARPPKRDDQPLRPKPKRLRPGRVHREKLLSEIGDEFRPIIEQLLRDGMPGVRKAIEKQNADAKETGKPEIDATPILSIAENNVSKARIAEWRDKADAALTDAADLDLRDLRSVVVSGTDLARSEQDRELAEQLKAALDNKVEADHQAWLSDLDAAIKQERVVRALRLSSRPVKAGAPLPSEMATTLSTQASAALAGDIAQDRWATVLDALAFSPVRSAVTPAGIPAEPTEELLADVRRLSDRIPGIAGLFGIDPAAVPKSAKRRRPRRRKPADKSPAGKSPADKDSTDKSTAKVKGDSKDSPKNGSGKPVADEPEKSSARSDSPETGTTEPLPTEADAKPTETEATEAEPAEAEPTEAEPAEAQPAEAQPAEAQPAEAQPAEAAAEKPQTDAAELEAAGEPLVPPQADAASHS